MCEKCREAHAERMEQINEEMDEQGVPEDSVLRGFADVHDACTHHPILMFLMQHSWPKNDSLVN